jgi:hypothetical protein
MRALRDGSNRPDAAQSHSTLQHLEISGQAATPTTDINQEPEGPRPNERSPRQIKEVALRLHLTQVVSSNWETEQGHGGVPGRVWLACPQLSQQQSQEWVINLHNNKPVFINDRTLSTTHTKCTQPYTSNPSSGAMLTIEPRSASLLRT